MLLWRWRVTEAAQGPCTEMPSGQGTGTTLTPLDPYGFAPRNPGVWREWARLGSLGTFQKVGKILHSMVSSLAQPREGVGVLSRGS